MYYFKEKVSGLRVKQSEVGLYPNNWFSHFLWFVVFVAVFSGRFGFFKYILIYLYFLERFQVVFSLSFSIKTNYLKKNIKETIYYNTL